MTLFTETIFAPRLGRNGTHFGEKRPVSDNTSFSHSGHPQAMLTEIYIEALLVNEELADQVWEPWDKGEIDDAVAYTAWILITAAGRSSA